jgi:cyclase
MGRPPPKSMTNKRLIARLDIKGPNLIKGVHLEGLRVIGNPSIYARRYYEQGADEIIYMDCVASLYGRNSLSEIIRSAARDIFVPLTVGGGIRSVEDVKELLRAGADKVAINTAALASPTLISDLAKRFGSQCVVVSIEAKRTSDNTWEAYTDNGRERTGKDVADWAEEAVGLGAGEILLTSVDREGTRKGLDIELTREIASRVSVPVIASGGMGKPEHLIQALTDGRADAVAMADILHYNRASIGELREIAVQADIRVRAYGD